MKRLLSILARAAIMVAAFAWLAEQPGQVHIEWRGYAVETSMALLVLATALAGYAAYFLTRLWRLMWRGPEIWSARRRLQRLELAHDDIEQGLMALAGGQAADAGRLAIAARKKLGVTPATLLLQAQAAQLARDTRTARALFRAMIEDDASAVPGYRGLIAEARREGNWDEARRLLSEASVRGIHAPWFDAVRFEDASRRGAWVQAGDALASLRHARFGDPETLKHHQAALFVAQSVTEAEQGSFDAAIQSGEQAVRQAPEWLPALINLARCQLKAGYERAMDRTLEKAWRLQPHPDVAALLKHGGEDGVAFYKKLERLSRRDDTGAATRLELARAALEAGIWGEARRHLKALIAANGATQETYRLLARLERRENGDERAASAWLAQMSEAPAGPAWSCSACGTAHEAWQAHCRTCHSFASLEWRAPGAGGMPHRPLLSEG